MSVLFWIQPVHCLGVRLWPAGEDMSVLFWIQPVHCLGVRLWPAGEDMSVLFWIQPCQSSVHHLLELHRFLSYLPFFSLIYLLIYLMGVSPDGGLGSPRWRFFQILPLSNLIYSSSYRSTLINGFLLTKFCLKLIENTYLPI